MWHIRALRTGSTAITPVRYGTDGETGIADLSILLQGISYPAYSQQPASAPGQALGYSAYPSADPAYDNSYNQAVNDYAASTLYGSQSSSHPVYHSREPQRKKSYNANRGVRPEQTFYCEVCKISCTGEMTYNEHLKGQQHRRKKAAASSEVPAGVNPVLTYCELCNVPCPGPEAYQAHIDGNKHKKVLALHTKMGKPIPEHSPVPVSKLAPETSGSTPVLGTPILNLKEGGFLSSTNAGVNPVLTYCELCNVPCSGPEAYQAHIDGVKHKRVLTLHTKMGKPIPELASIPVSKPAPETSASATVLGTPTLNFKEGGRLNTTNADETEADQPAENSAEVLTIQSLNEVISQAKQNSGTASVARGPQPVGEKFVCVVEPDDGKPASFFCQLCICPIGDSVAKGQHVRGKRHRYAYKTQTRRALYLRRRGGGTGRPQSH